LPLRAATASPSSSVMIQVKQPGFRGNAVDAGPEIPRRGPLTRQGYGKGHHDGGCRQENFRSTSGVPAEVSPTSRLKTAWLVSLPVVEHNACGTVSNFRRPPSNDPTSQHVTHTVSESTGLAEADDKVDRHCDHECGEEVGEQSVPQGDPAGGSG
jgi:hypothetical protein